MGSICSTIFLKLKGSPPDPNDSKPDVPPRRSDRYEFTDTTEGEGRDNDAMQRDDEAPVTKKQEETRMDAKTIDWRYARDPTLKHRTVLSPHDIEGFIKEGKKLARGLYDYSGFKDDETTMVFDKGDVLEVLKQDGDWWKARNLETGEEGYVPSTFVALEDSLELYPWFHGNVSRADAIILLKASRDEPGTFLVRESESKIGTYVLSIMASESQVKHYRIKNLNLGGCYIFESSKFESLPAMIQKYETEGEERLCNSLTKPCPKPKPRMWDLSRKTRDHWEIRREELVLIKRLGSGNFGEVWQGLWKGAIDVAVKTLKEGTMEPVKFLEEATIMKQLQHPKLIRLYAVCTQEEPIYIVTELMSNGSLKEYLHKNPDIHITHIIDIATQVADGMCYIERKQLIHRDLASRNILMGDGLQVKICDFGLARVINEEVYVASQGAKCPIKWTAPEAVFYQKYTIKSDVWAFGILLVELTNGGNTPYPGMNNQVVVERLQQGFRHPQPGNCPDQLYEIMLGCWYKDPSDRPTFEILFKDLEEFYEKSFNYLA